MKFKLTQEAVKVHSVKYSNPDAPVTTVYIPKDSLREEGKKGWPASVEVEITLQFD